ncbi:MAG: glycerol-3-phosphate 1-O-acyltransferase PlsY [Candidatus Binatia bacterium]
MLVALIIFAYLLGSIPSGYIVGALAGVDVRNAGSGNIGATNVARIVGKRLGALTLLADTAKGYVPVFIALRMGLSPAAVALVAIASFLGHLYPVFLRFKGGRGVATAFGALLALAPVATLILIGVFAVIVLCGRRISLGSIAAALAAPFALWSISAAPAFIAMSAFLGAMVILRHRDNIKRLLDGTEPRLGEANSR